MNLLVHIVTHYLLASAEDAIQDDLKVLEQALVELLVLLSVLLPDLAHHFSFVLEVDDFLKKEVHPLFCSE